MPGLNKLIKRYLSYSWKTIIGLEIHAQLKTETKLFSAARTSYQATPNTNVSLFDAAIPGTLPLLNGKCVNQVIRLGLALNGTINRKSSFDRKHYFYPDLPHGYQITQHQKPLVFGGYLDLNEWDGLAHVKKIKIQQIQLEQDTGKTIYDHEGEKILLDINRAGIALAEIVSAPDFRNVQQACAFLVKLQAILRKLDICDANMEDGSLRCDANVSVQHEHMEDYSGVRCEIKNLNSIKNVAMALDYEMKRHIELLSRGNKIEAETRGFDEVAKVTFKLRGKEGLKDYRYMPDPDLPYLCIDEATIDRIKTSMPILLDQQKRDLASRYGIGVMHCNFLVENPNLAYYFEQVATSQNAKRVFDWLTSELIGQLRKFDRSFLENNVTVHQFGVLINMIERNEISSKIAKNVLHLMIAGDTRSPDEIVNENNWRQITDEKSIELACQKVLNLNDKSVIELMTGKSKLFPWFVGQVLKETKGKADPDIIETLLRQKLNMKNTKE